MSGLAEALQEGDAAPARLRTLLKEALARAEIELGKKRSGYDEPVTLAFGATDGGALAAALPVDGAFRADVALADERERQVRERREIAAGADRAAAGYARMNLAIEQGEQCLERLEADAGEAFREHVGPQRHRRAHRPHRQRLADTGCMAAQQVQLQCRQIGLVDARLGEVAEAGVDAVNGRIARGLGIHHRARRPHPCARLCGEAHFCVLVCNRQQVFQLKMMAV